MSQYSRWPVLSGGGGGSGTVTSVGIADGSTTPIFTISGSPVTTSGTLTLTLSTESANTVLAGPTSGSAAQPTFRALLAADIPSSIPASKITAPGSNGELMFNNNGVLAGDSGMVYTLGDQNLAVQQMSVASGIYGGMYWANSLIQAYALGAWTPRHVTDSLSLSILLSSNSGSGFQIGGGFSGGPMLEVDYLGNVWIDKALAFDSSSTGITDSSSHKSISPYARILYDSGGTNTAINYSSTSGITIGKAVQSYNGNTTVGNGLSSVVGSVNLTAQTGSISNTTIFTPSAAGMYKASVYMVTTTAGSAGTVSCTIGWTDSAAAQTATPASTLTLTSNTYSSGIAVIYSAASDAITYSTTVSGAVGSPAYQLVISLERLS